MSKPGMAECKQYLKARGVRWRFTVEMPKAYNITIQSTTRAMFLVIRLCLMYL